MYISYVSDYCKVISSLAFQHGGPGFALYYTYMKIYQFFMFVDLYHKSKIYQQAIGCLINCYPSAFIADSRSGNRGDSLSKKGGCRLRLHLTGALISPIP